ncbi:MAG: hypothetical protein F8N39_03055 [Clostridiaceae bacterium]|nr:hypothetical protein [Clostridiaceae bacterium]
MATHNLSSARPVGCFKGTTINLTGGSPYLDVTGAGFLIGIKQINSGLRIEIDGVPILPADNTKAVPLSYSGVGSTMPFLWKFKSNLKVWVVYSTDINIQYSLD